MLNSTALNKIAKFIDDMVVSADYTLNGVTYPANFRRSIISGNQVIKHVYLTTKDPIGTITRVRLWDKDGDVFSEKTLSVVHEKNKGRMFEFVFTVEEMMS